MSNEKYQVKISLAFELVSHSWVSISRKYELDLSHALNYGRMEVNEDVIHVEESAQEIDQNKQR